MPLLERIISPINALLPDLSRVPQRRQAVGAIVASLVLHLLLLLLFIAVAAVLPENTRQAIVPEANTTPLEVEIVAPPEEDLVTPEELQQEAKREYLNSSGLAKSKDEPKDAIFESDQNMKAASELPARGILPLPSQDGSTARVGPMFKNESGRLGREDAGETKDEATPTKLSEQAAKQAQTQPALKQQPQADATPEDKFKNLPEVEQPNADEIAVAQKVKPRMSSPDMALRPLPAPTERQDMAKLTTPAPKRGRDAKYQGRQWETRVDGSISNRGRKSVDAVKTPRGVYTKQVSAQIGSRWTYFVRSHPDRYTFGYTRVRFYISHDGTVSNVQVVENTANETFALMCQQSVFEAEISPVPEDVHPVMTDGKLEMTFTFNYVPFQ